MTVEIRELVIRAVVEDGETKKNQSSGATSDEAERIIADAEARTIERIERAKER